ncbi:hypothetical protein [Caldimonas brevitalea]|uniref:Uncharacterized protein n=1 Tax=Caldimonas brevitalea TaxID=413882 RepID=A0A0G3BHY6_9BURK|nr:hypothetical protein [Caldimonas brevitalea]AKJ27598.1 hypothetical protein AAW51_0907 [Caldimonas brevitalea]
MLTACTRTVLSAARRQQLPLLHDDSGPQRRKPLDLDAFEHAEERPTPADLHRARADVNPRFAADRVMIDARGAARRIERLKRNATSAASAWAILSCCHGRPPCADDHEE